MVEIAPERETIADAFSKSAGDMANRWPEALRQPEVLVREAAKLKTAH